MAHEAGEYYASDDRDLHGTWTVRRDGFYVCQAQEGEESEKIAKMIAEALNEYDRKIKLKRMAKKIARYNRTGEK